MAKTREQKQSAVKSYGKKLKDSKSVVFVNFQGLNVKDTYEFRKKCRAEKGEYLVVKKTLMNIAFKDAGFSIDARKFSGDVGTVFGFEDEILAPKIAHAFSKTHEALKPIGGILENTLIDGAKVLELSRLPSRKELLAKIVGSLESPLSGFVQVLAGNIRGFVQVIKALSEKKV